MLLLLSADLLANSTVTACLNKASLLKFWGSVLGKCLTAELKS